MRAWSTLDPRRVGRVFFRGSAALALSAVSWKTDSRFVDSDGSALSDHLAVAVDLEWRTQSLPASPALAP